MLQSNKTQDETLPHSCITTFEMCHEKGNVCLYRAVASAGWRPSAPTYTSVAVVCGGRQDGSCSDGRAGKDVIGRELIQPVLCPGFN